MSRLTPRLTMAAGVGLILAANLAILTMAGWNRRGVPFARLELTERELAMPDARQDEGTGLDLTLILTHRPPARVRRAALWRHEQLPPFHYPWFDRAKLAGLGFRVDLDPADPKAEDRCSNMIPRRVWLVLEYDGPAWRKWLAGREEQVAGLRRKVEAGAGEPGKLENAEALLSLDRVMRSRLFAVDAGVDPAALRRRYADRERYAVVPGYVRAEIVRADGREPVLGGEVMKLDVRRIHVPRGLRGPLEPLMPAESWDELEAREREAASRGWPDPVPPRYRAVMAIGRRYEPWLVEVDR